VGHEIDFTIADFVSDQRAPTPSAAAELISPDKDTLLININQLKNSLNYLVEKNLQTKKEQLAHLNHRLKQLSGLAHIEQQKQLIDSHELRLNRNVTQTLTQYQVKLQHLKQRLVAQSPLQNFDQQQTSIASLKRRLEASMLRKQEQASDKLQRLSSHLHTISPLATLKRGYSITRHTDTVIHSIDQVSEKQKLNIMLSDGDFDCEVLKTSLKPPLFD
jgi:exodeoxyribonuclease VII large subunit